MQYITKLQLAAIHELCDVEDKSTEFMIQYMQDAVRVDHDAVMHYLSLPQKEIDKLRKDVHTYMDFFERNFGQADLNE